MDDPHDCLVTQRLFAYNIHSGIRILWHEGFCFSISFAKPTEMSRVRQTSYFCYHVNNLSFQSTTEEMCIDDINTCLTVAFDNYYYWIRILTPFRDSCAALSESHIKLQTFHVLTSGVPAFKLKGGFCDFSIFSSRSVIITVTSIRPKLQ